LEKYSIELVELHVPVAFILAIFAFAVGFVLHVIKKNLDAHGIGNPDGITPMSMQQLKLEMI